MKFRGTRDAFGAPGIPPRWAHGDKWGVGTSYSSDSRVWFTLWRGILTEIYYPMIDHPQVRDLQFLVSDGSSWFQEERRHLAPTASRLSDHDLGYRIVNTDPGGRYALHKEVIADPHLPCVLQRVRLRRGSDYRGPLKLFVLCAPHLDVGGWGNNAYVVELTDRTVLTAERNGTWLALGATVPMAHASAGFVGRSDGWTDLAENFHLDWEFDRALGGNTALTGELAYGEGEEFTVGIAFGRGLANAVTALLQSFGTPYPKLRRRFTEQWNRACRRIPNLGSLTRDGGNLYHGSYSLLLGHEDKIFPGAFIASLSIPWGNSKSDEDRGGYHLVWTRDLVQIASGLLAAGNSESPLRALIYLAASQMPNGGFPQNFWLNGDPYWSGVQLDEVAFPILLAGKLRAARALQEFDPYPMILRAARFLVEHGPVTAQERWEEASGYSPSTLAVHISGLVCAAAFAQGRRDRATARFLEEYADFLESHLERWTVTRNGTLLSGVPRHYVRILPLSPDDPNPVEDVDRAQLVVSNQPPGERTVFPASEVVDGGFLELVRFGIRSADDPVVVDSVRVLDSVLQVDTPYGPCWRRYNHDGYGQRDDGGPYAGWGRGRAWPLLTGERGHYELAAGRDPSPYLHALERFATPTGLLPEQVWDQPDRPELHMHLGRSTGAAMPLMWAHAEYLKLLRSISDGRIFDQPSDVVLRYHRRRPRTRFEIWKPDRRPAFVEEGAILRIIAPEPFRLRHTPDDWASWEDTESTATEIGVHFVDLESAETGALTFTFYWLEREQWEGVNYCVPVRPEEGREAAGA